MKMHTPEILIKNSKNLEGLCLLIGKRGSSKSVIFKELIQSLPNETKITVIQDAKFNFQPGNNISFISTAEIIDNPNCFSSDTQQFFMNTENIKLINWAIARAEEGYGITFCASGLDFETGLCRLADEVSENTEFALRKLSRILKSALEIKSVESSLGETYAMQLYLQRPELQTLVAAGKFEELRETLSSGINGTFTLNQSLAELVITRKIDFKSAFANSRNPAQLDQLLKKAGV